jgi:ectoine hydroxylase-related dioxygenase (phytanoyl-CoA dioxygenase family)
MAMNLMSDDRVAFETNGFLLKREVFSADEMKSLKAQCKELAEDTSNTGVNVYPGDRCRDDLRNISCDPRLVATLKNIVNEEMDFLSVKSVHKSASLGFPSPWHQDRAYWKGSAKISIWIAMDDATVANGCLKVIPGSHLDFLDHNISDTNKFKNSIADDALADREQISVEMAKGDALFFHDLLLHSSYENKSGKDRWSIIPTYRDAAIHDPTTLRIELWKNPIRL